LEAHCRLCDAVVGNSRLAGFMSTTRECFD
jgi:hypothetical protein